MTVELAHTLEGPADAPLVVLSNSLGSTIEMWQPQLPVLSERFRVLRYDHRGHGRSPVPPGLYELQDLAGDLLALLDRLSVPRAHLCGVSLGGMVAMWLAIHHPERIDKLVLCSTSARFDPAGAAGMVERAATVRAQGTAAIAGVVVGRWLTPGFAEANLDLVDQLRTMVASTPDEGYASCCQAIAVMDLERLVATITAPTLVIAAVQDPSIPPEHGERIARAIAGARLELIEDAAHLVNLQQPETVNRLLLEHLG